MKDSKAPEEPRKNSAPQNHSFVRVRPSMLLTTRVKLSHETFGLVVRRMDGRAEVEGSSPSLRTTGTFVY